MAARWAVFMDKDGTLVHDVPFNTDPEKMRFTAGAEEALHVLGRLQVPLIVVSNQPGIALGRFPVAALEAVIERLQSMFATCGARLTAFYHCPHHPEGSDREYAITCDCRKPAPGLIRRAASERDLDLARCWMVGDILDDIEAGSRAGCATILVDNGNETEWRSSPMRAPDYLVGDLLQAAGIIDESAMRLQRRERSRRAWR